MAPPAARLPWFTALLAAAFAPSSDFARPPVLKVDGSEGNPMAGYCIVPALVNFAGGIVRVAMMGSCGGPEETVRPLWHLHAEFETQGLRGGAVVIRTHTSLALNWCLDAGEALASARADLARRSGASAVPHLAAGDRVEGRRNDGRWYPATISSESTDVSFVLDWFDGDPRQRRRNATDVQPVATWWSGPLDLDDVTAGEEFLRASLQAGLAECRWACERAVTCQAIAFTSEDTWSGPNCRLYASRGQEASARPADEDKGTSAGAGAGVGAGAGAGGAALFRAYRLAWTADGPAGPGYDRVEQACVWVGTGLELDNVSVVQCAAACDEDPLCAAFSYVVHAVPNRSYAHGLAYGYPPGACWTSHTTDSGMCSNPGTDRYAKRSRAPPSIDAYMRGVLARMLRVQRCDGGPGQQFVVAEGTHQLSVHPLQDPQLYLSYEAGVFTLREDVRKGTWFGVPPAQAFALNRRWEDFLVPLFESLFARWLLMRVMFVLQCLLALLYAVSLVFRCYRCCRKLVGTFSHADVSTNFMHAVRRAGSWYASVCAPGRGGDGIDRKVRCRVVERRLMRARSGVRIGTYVLMFLFMAHVQKARHMLNRTDSHHEVNEYLNIDPILPLTFMTLILLVLDNIPQTVTPRMLDAAHTIFSGFWAFRYKTLASYPDPQSYLFEASAIWTCRLMQLFVFGNLRLTVVLNVAMTIVDVLAFEETFHFPTGLQDPLLAWERNHYRQWYVLRQTLGCAAVLLLAWTVNYMSVQEAKAIEEARQTHGAKKLVTHLLDGMCDAVAHLDSTLRITTGSRRLAALLLRQAGGQSAMKGFAFLDCVDSEERQKFMDYIERVAHQAPEEPVQSIHVHLRDSLGNSVPVQLFCTSLQDETAGGTVEHLLGVVVTAETHGPQQDRAAAADGVGDLVSASAAALGIGGGSAPPDRRGAGTAGDEADPADDASSAASAAAPPTNSAPSETSSDTSGGASGGASGGGGAARAANPPGACLLLGTGQVLEPEPRFIQAFGTGRCYDGCFFPDLLADPLSFFSWMRREVEDIHSNRHRLPRKANYGPALVQVGHNSKAANSIVSFEVQLEVSFADDECFWSQPLDYPVVVRLLWCRRHRRGRATHSVSRKWESWASRVGPRPHSVAPVVIGKHSMQL